MIEAVVVIVIFTLILGFGILMDIMDSFRRCEKCGGKLIYMYEYTGTDREPKIRMFKCRKCGTYYSIRQG